MNSKCEIELHCNSNTTVRVENVVFITCATLQDELCDEVETATSFKVFDDPTPERLKDELIKRRREESAMRRSTTSEGSKKKEDDAPAKKHKGASKESSEPSEARGHAPKEVTNKRVKQPDEVTTKQQKKAEAAASTKSRRAQEVEAANKLMAAAFRDTVVSMEEIDDLVASLPEEHGALIDAAEVRNGERLGVVAGMTDTFQSICKNLGIPSELWGVYNTG